MAAPGPTLPDSIQGWSLFLQHWPLLCHWLSLHLMVSVPFLSLWQDQLCSPWSPTLGLQAFITITWLNASPNREPRCLCTPGRCFLCNSLGKSQVSVWSLCPFHLWYSPFHFVGLSTQTPAPLFSNPQDIFLDSWPLPTCQAKDTDLAVRVKIPTWHGHNRLVFLSPDDLTQPDSFQFHPFPHLVHLSLWQNKIPSHLHYPLILFGSCLKN